MTLRALLLSLAFFLLPLAAPARGEDAPAGEAERRSLLEGVERLALPGVPGTISVFGKDAFPLVAAPSGGQPAPLVAAARVGRGRAVLFGHDYFGQALEVGDTATLVANVLRWAAGDAKAPVRVGLHRRSAAPPELAQAGFQVVLLRGADWRTKLADVDVAVLDLAALTPEEVDGVRRRLEDGLGVVGGMPGWGWMQLNPGRSLAADNPGNRLLAPAGLVWGEGTVEKPRDGVLVVDGPAPRLTHAAWALDGLVGASTGKEALAGPDRAVATAALTRAVREVPPGDRLLRPRLLDLLREASPTRRVPTPAHPLTAEDGLARVLLTFEIEEARSAAPEAVEAHPAAAGFPGVVDAEAPRFRRTVTVDTRVPGWHGTGLYAAPGEVVRATLPPAAEGAGLLLQLGAHTDELWSKAAWRRAPAVTRRVPLAARTTEAAGAFGGLVYVVVPEGCAAGTIEVVVEGAVAAPRFVLGETTLDAWRETERAHPAPWAELETGKVILTLPSVVVRGLDDPEALMRWWDGVMDGCADLAAIPRERRRPERYVADEQIVAGYMHAGYPIMTHLDAAPRFVDLPKLSTQGDWGMFHEMGHNHQHPDWTFHGTTEVTCNLFSLYLMETVCTAATGHGAMSPEKVAERRERHLAAGADFATWQREPFTALICYAELADAFGWDAYKRAFAAYRQLPRDERPRTDADKRDQWLVRMSRAVGRDLGPFFASWGIPVSDAARAAVADLEPWMPDAKPGR